MNTKELLFSRKSVRTFTGEPISDEDLSFIIKAAKAAPVAMGQYDNYHLTLITNKDLLTTIERAGGELFGDPDRKMLYNAPTLVVVSATVAPGAENYTYSSAAMIVHNMALAATELGVGSCDIWGCIGAAAKQPALVAKLNLPEGVTPCCAIALGKTDETFPLREVPEDRITLNVVE